MELILISSNKLKVILTAEEMKKYKLHKDSDVSHASEKKHLSSLLDDIKRKSGFSTDTGSVYIELFESIDGGCEMFITKEIHKLADLKNEVGADITKSIFIYRFTSANDIILASKRIVNSKNSYLSQLFSDDLGVFYLVLTAFGEHKKQNDAELIFMEEYGERIDDECFKDYLDEHARPICRSDAVRILSQM